MLQNRTKPNGHHPGMQKENYDQYRNDCQQLAEQIAQTDREIDQRVYLLYGLTEEEIGIVESR